MRTIPARFTRQYGPSAPQEYAATAIHEAGHAIVTLLCDRKFRYVTLRPKGNFAGHVLGYPTYRIRQIDLIEQAAGYIAETMIVHGDSTPWLPGFLGHSNSRGDVEFWNEILEVFPESDPEEEFSLAVEHVNAYRPEIETLAEMLMARQTVTGREAARLLGMA